MRTLMIASAGIALVSAGAAQADQRVGLSPMAPHGGGQMWHSGGMGAAPHVQTGRGNRWGSNVGGHWWGGVNAPGGWNAYRRPARGYVLPSYWISPRFYINDWSGYGLSQPGYGYNWVRYYDDAVLIDGRGSVYDVADGIDWDGYDQGYAVDDTVYAGTVDRGGYAQGGYVDDRYAQDAYTQAPGTVTPGYAQAPAYGAQYDTYADRSRRNTNGVVGAVVGGVAGGIAGSAIAGRGDKLGGTLIGGGLGAAAGYAVGSAATGSHRRYYSSAPGYGQSQGYTPGPNYRAPQGYATGYDRRGSDGLAGAAIGGVVGGVAGNAIAGRGDKLGGTLIGAGVGAAAGYAVDRATSGSDRQYRSSGYPTGYGRQGFAPDGYGAGYSAPRAQNSGGYYRRGGGSTVTGSGGATVTTTATGGYAAGGYYYPAGSTTTVVVQSSPVVTTTTTETYDDVTYSRPHARHTKIVRRWRAPAKCACR